MSGSNAGGRGYSFRISAEGMREFAADINRVSAESAGAQQAFGRLIQASPELASALTRAEEATKRAADSARELREANDRAAASAASLPGQLARAAGGFDQLESRAQGARRAVGDFRGALELLGAGAVSSALGPLTQQIGNVADAFGTAGLAARAGTGAIGMVVPVLGAAAAAAGGLYLAYQTLQAQAEKYGTEQERLNAITGFGAEAADAYRRALQATDGVLETAEERAVALANSRRQEAFETLRAAEATNRLAQAEAARVASNLQGSLATVGEDPGPYAAMGFGGVSPAESAGRDAFLREQLRLVQERTASLAQEAEELARRRALMGSEAGVVLSATPFGPPAPPATRTSSAARVAGGGADSISRMVEQNVARAAEAERREAERARELIARDEARALQERERLNERTTDNITRYLADGFADAFRETGGGFAGLLRSMQQAALSTPIRILAETVLRPVVSSAVSSLGLGGGGGAGGLLSGAGQLLGLGGVGSSVSGLLSTPLWGSSAAGAGMFAEASAASMGLSQSSGAMLAGMGPTLGATLGVAGLGALGGGMIAQFTGGNTTGGSIGGGLGAAAGFMIGGPVGALIGGAAGGAIGGLFGGGRGGSFYNQVVNIRDGRLALGDSGAKNAGEQLNALQRQTAAEIQQINAQLDALGLVIDGAVNLGSGVGGTQQFGSVGAAAGQFRLAASDPRIQRAIDQAGGGLGALGAAQEAGAFIQLIEQLAGSARDAADPIGAITRQFDGLRETAIRLGFGLDEVNAAQQRAIQQAMRPVATALGGIADYARGLRTANDNSGNPLSRLRAADQQFEQTITAALSGDTRALTRVTADAEQFRQTSRSVFGTGTGFADAERRIVAALEQVGLAGEERLTAGIFAAETRAAAETVSGAIARLQEEVGRLRADIRQQSASPLALRA